MEEKNQQIIESMLELLKGKTVNEIRDIMMSLDREVKNRAVIS